MNNSSPHFKKEKTLLTSKTKCFQGLKKQKFFSECKPSQQEIWNNIAERWSKFRKRTPEDTLEFLKNKKGKVLDLGCGSGRNLIVNPNITYYGVDFSEKMLKYAEKDAQDKKINAIFFKVYVGKEKLPFKNGFFNSAIFISALHCIGGAKNRENALRELYRVLKKGSEAIITVWDKQSIKEFKDKNIKESFLKWKGNKTYDRYYYFYDKEELEKILKKIGFKSIKIAPKENIIKSKYSKKNLIFYVKK